jgi:hypothetical protein
LVNPDHGGAPGLVPPIEDRAELADKKFFEVLIDGHAVKLMRRGGEASSEGRDQFP